jgi:hypothetical protein
MKFITKFLLLTVIFASSASAEWVPYANNSDRSMFLYYETLSIKKSNNVFSIQILKNFVEPEKVVLEGKTIVYKSVIDKQLIDCSKNLYRNTEIIFFEEWSSSGKELYKSVIDKVKWYEIKSNSVQEGLMQKVCFNV